MGYLRPEGIGIDGRSSVSKLLYSRSRPLQYQLATEKEADKAGNIQSSEQYSRFHVHAEYIEGSSMLLLMITLPIIPYCIPYCMVVRKSTVPFQLSTVVIDWEVLTAPVVVKSILILPSL